MSRLPAASVPSQPGLVVNETVTSYHNYSQFSLAKLETSTHLIKGYLRDYIQLFKSANAETSDHVKTINSLRSPTV